MKKVLGRAVLVLLISSSLHAGPLTPADMALFDASPEDTHAAAVAMRAAGFTSLKQIATQGGIGENVVQYLNNTPDQGYSNTTALQTIMGNWSDDPKTFGVIGDYQPTDHADSLYHKIAHTSGSVFADLGYGTEYGIESDLRAKIRDGLFADLGSSGSASDRMTAIFGALTTQSGLTSGNRNIPARGDRNLLDWIGSFTDAGGGGENIVPYLNNTPDQGYTNTTALQTIMGDWAADPKTFGVIGEFIPTNAADRDSLYHRITDTSAPDWTQTPPTLRGIYGTLGSDYPSESVSERLQKIISSLGNFSNWTDGTRNNIYDSISIWRTGIDWRSGNLGCIKSCLGGESYSESEDIATRLVQINNALGEFPGAGNPSHAALYEKITYIDTDEYCESSIFSFLGGPENNIFGKLNQINNALGEFTGAGDPSHAALYEKITYIHEYEYYHNSIFSFLGGLENNIFDKLNAIVGLINTKASTSRNVAILNNWNTDNNRNLYDWINNSWENIP